MKRKTSVTLSEETVQAIEDVVGPGANRSRVIEEAVNEYLERRRREARDRREIEILNRHADRLNREAEDVLAYQAEP